MNSLKRIAQTLATAVLVMVLIGAAAYFLASLDKHPKHPRYMVRANAKGVCNG